MSPVRACLATASAPRIAMEAAGSRVPASIRSTTPGSSTATRAPKSPPRAAEKKASTTARWRARSGSGAGTAAPFTRRRALLASCRAAAGVRPTMGAISSKGKSNMSCRTNASLSAGARVSSTTSRARPTESASTASSSGCSSLSGPMTGSGTCTPKDSSRRRLRDRSMFRHTRATIVVSHPPRFSTPPAPDRLRRSQVS